MVKKLKNKMGKDFLKEIRESRKLMKKTLKPIIHYDSEYDIFYLWFGGKRKVFSTIEVDEDMRFDTTKDGLIVSVEIENFKEKLKDKSKMKKQKK